MAPARFPRSRSTCASDRVRAARKRCILCAKVNALLDGRVSVSYDDVNDAIVPALRHRLLRNFQAEAENVSPSRSSNRRLKRLKKPRRN